MDRYFVASGAIWNQRTKALIDLADLAIDHVRLRINRWLMASSGLLEILE